jgi:cell division protein FtsA
MNMGGYLVAIDLGTTKVVSIVGEKNKINGRIRILAYDEAPSAGIRYGQVENIQSVVNVVKTTLDNVKAIAKITEVKEVYVGIAGLHIRYIENSTETLREKYDELITKEEIKKLESNARKMHVNPGEEIIHAIPQTYSIDDVNDITDPIGRLGSKLAGHFMVIIEKGISTRHTEVCINRMNLSLKELVLEPIASARAILSEDEKDLGVAMIDIGGGTTDLVIYKDKVIKHTAIIPFGGNTITQDIKAGCSIPLRDAENIKIQYGSCVSSMVSENSLITVPGINGREHKEISFKSLSYIIEARMVEIMDMILYEIQRYTNSGQKLMAGIVFTGGGAQMTNLRELVKLKIGMDVRIGKPNYISESSPKEIIHPKYSTAVGLIMCGFDSRDTEKKVEDPMTISAKKGYPENPNDTTKDADDSRHQRSIKEFFKNILYNERNDEI